MNLKNEAGILRSVGKLCLYGSIVIGGILLVLCLMAMNAMNDVGGYLNIGSSLSKIPMVFLLLDLLFTITGIGVGTLLNGIAQLMVNLTEMDDGHKSNENEQDYEKYRKEMLEKFKIKSSDKLPSEKNIRKNTPFDI